MGSPTQHRGAGFEQLALNYLTQHGCQCLMRNFRCKQGEIDLIMRHGQDLVFVEVRYRRSNAFGGAAASVTASKQRKLLAAARWYLARYGQPAELPGCRFDVVAITGAEAPYAVDWLPGAFTADL